MARSGADQIICPDHDALAWEGAIEVEHTAGWSRPWRLPYSRIGLFPTEALRTRAAMGAGVRIVFGTDSTIIAGRAAVPEEDFSPIDLVIDGEPAGSARVADDGWFRFTGLAAQEKVIELWLPQFGQLRLIELLIDRDARVWRAARPRRPRLLVYGSSITHCRAASSPTRTWPALVAREFDADLTCLGFGGQCHLDPMVARLMRDRPADLIITCLGINIYGNGSFNSRSLRPAVLGFLSTVRDGHPQKPIVVISPIASPSRESAIGGADLTLAEVRAEVEGAVRILREHGDTAVHVIDGRTLIGPDQAHLLHDGLHPDAQGYELMARSLSAALRERHLIGPGAR